MLRSFLWIGFIAALMTCPTYARAQDQAAWQDAQLKKLSGRWTTMRQEKAGPDKIRQLRVELEFGDGKVKVVVFQKDASKRLFDGNLRVLGVERVKPGSGLGSFARLSVGSTTGTGKYDVYFDFVGDQLVLVGVIGWRPFEGFQLSGEYKQGEMPK